MKGTIVKLKNGLAVTFSITATDTYIHLTLPLNPYESTEGLSVGNQVDFDIQKFWETGIERSFDVAVLKTPSFSDDFQIDPEDEFERNDDDDSLFKSFCEKYPNDYDLGKEIRKHYNNSIIK